MLAIPEMEYKRVLACTGRLSKTNMGVTAQTDEKNSEKVLVNRKVFCTFTIYYNKGLNERRELYDCHRLQNRNCQYSCGQWAITLRELAQEFGVCIRTIRNDITVLSYGYPIFTKLEADRGIFIMDSYKLYSNTLISYEQEKLKKMYDVAEGEDKKSWNVFSKNMVRTS